jgi:hypothetical protein
MKLISVLALAAALPMVQATDTASGRAGFMVGCWEVQRGTSLVREVWRAATADFLIGNGTTVAAGVLKEFEHTRIESQAGVVALVAQPGGAPPTRFTLDPASKVDEAIFVNMQHDFPKRVVYRKTAPDAMLAFIDGGEGTPKIQFPYKKCS